MGQTTRFTTSRIEDHQFITSLTVNSSSYFPVLIRKSTSNKFMFFGEERGGDVCNNKNKYKQRGFLVGCFPWSGKRNTAEVDFISSIITEWCLWPRKMHLFPSNRTSKNSFHPECKLKKSKQYQFIITHLHTNRYPSQRTFISIISNMWCEREIMPIKPF